ncbi:uncharacterized protein LOC110446641 [Mizuhopecten yessoensis]|uniref:uncharacterized protein LOC110446641 n=1 Tax=Mizuhopecten yessoensis TaxID=6573 RepID=UPI000B45903B|nr:uncharacterized protein LOC110446641 [Mizuhopecten yessoensis]
MRIEDTNNNHDIAYTEVIGRRFSSRSDLKSHVVTKVPWMLDHTISLIVCVNECDMYTDCVFVGFNNESQECQVFREDNTTWSTEVRYGHDWMYFEEDILNIPFVIGSFVCGTDGYVAIDTHCFKVHEENSTFDDAKTTCSTEGGRMAVLDNQPTFIALNDHIRANHAGMVGYLLGLTDRAVEGEWRWENGNLIGNLPEFNRDQPNDNDRRYNGQGADCGYVSVVFHNLHKKVDRLYDDICSHPANFVCERVIV